MIPNRIVVIGGSTVHGQGDPEGGGFVTRLRKWHESTSPQTHRVFNLGVGGDGVKEMLQRGFAEAQARRAELIILYPGLNDVRRSGSLTATCQTESATIRSTLVALVNQLTELAPLAMMGPVPPDESRTSPFRGKWFFTLQDAKEMNDIIADVAREFSLPFLPIFEAWLNRANVNDLLFDGLHCNTKGHQLLYEELRKFLSERY